MKRIILAYAAGLVDGEGTITLSREKSWSEFRHPVVVVTSTTSSLVRFMKREFGGVVSNKRASKKGHLPSKTWAVINRKAILFLKAMLPYLREPEKRRRALLIIKQYLKVTPRNGRYTQEQRKEKQNFERQFWAGKSRYSVKRRIQCQ